MNDNIYRYLMEDKKRKIEHVNRNAWKYKFIYQFNLIFHVKRLLKLSFKKRQRTKKAFTKGQ